MTHYMIDPTTTIYEPNSDTTDTDVTMAYIAHPVGDDVERNIEDVVDIMEQVHMADIATVPMAPYRPSVEYLDDNDPVERRKGMDKNTVYFERGWMDECWLTGPAFSSGMQEETALAAEYGIPVKYSPRISDEVKAYLEEQGIDQELAYATLPRSYTLL